MAHPSSRSSLYLWLILLLGIALGGVLFYRFFSDQGPDRAGTEPTSSTAAGELPPYGYVPPFVLTERSGKTITNQDLSGKIWVADFIFTTCPGPCPLVTASMAKIQDAVAHDPNVQLVTFTVDPQDDTLAVLATYANKFNADPYRWWFLTGPEKPLYDLIQNGFLLAVQDNHGRPLQDGEFVVTHSTQMVLVDGNGVKRGFFDGVGSDGRSDLLKAIKTLEKEEQN